MARYINEGDLLVKIMDLNLDHVQGDDGRELCQVIQAIPTADVREVVHGEWRKVYPTYELNIIARKHEPCYVCSKCNAHVDVKTPFCPICGAYMRKE